MMMMCPREFLPDTVENINEDQEQGDKETHPARHHMRVDQKADPADDNKHEAWQVDL